MPPARDADSPRCPCCGFAGRAHQRACVLHGEQFCRRCQGECGAGLETMEACRAALSAPQARKAEAGAGGRPARRSRAHGADVAPVSAIPPLPGVLAEIAEIASREGALALSLAVGGRWLHIPKPAYLAHHHEHALVIALGPRAAAAVAARMGGGTLYIPLARRDCARHLAGQGQDAGAIAARLGTTRSTIRRYLRPA